MAASDEFRVELDALEGFASQLRSLITNVQTTASKASQTSLDSAKIGGFTGATSLTATHGEVATELHVLLNDVQLQIDRMRSNLRQTVQAYEQTDQDHRVTFVHMPELLVPEKTFHDRYVEEGEQGSTDAQRQVLTDSDNAVAAARQRATGELFTPYGWHPPQGAPLGPLRPTG